MKEWAGGWLDPYAIVYNRELGQLAVADKSLFLSAGEMRFATKEDAENCVKAVGEERIKKYYFGVPEDERE